MLSEILVTFAKLFVEVAKAGSDIDKKQEALMSAEEKLVMLRAKKKFR